MPTPNQKRLSELLKRIFPKATRSYHPQGVLLTQPAGRQLVACQGGLEKPFDVLFTRPQWEKLWDAAARAKAELSYALVSEAGTAALVLPLSGVDKAYPDWRSLEDARLFDEDEDDYVSCEVVRFPRAVGNTVAVPEAKWSEWELQVACVAWLRAERPQVVAWSTPNEAAHKKWRHYALSGATAGAPDLTCVAPGGRVLLVELKTTRGLVSEAQGSLGRQVRANGTEYHVVRSLGQFQRLFADCAPTC